MSIKIPTTMWDSRPVTTRRRGLTRDLHVGKVWRDWTDPVSVFTRSTTDNVAMRPPPRRHPQMRLIRGTTIPAAVGLLLAAGLTGCTSDDEPTAAPTDVVIGADLADGSAVDTAYARALQLRIEQINASGRLGDRRLVLRIRDNRSDRTSSLRNVSTFADDPAVVAVVAGACNQCIVDA